MLDLLGRVEVIGHRDRRAFAPRITVRLRGGTTYQGEYQGQELEWDFSTESRRISALFDDLGWPREKLDGIVETVANLEREPKIDSLVQLCVRG